MSIDAETCVRQMRDIGQVGLMIFFQTNNPDDRNIVVNLLLQIAWLHL